MMDQQRLGYIEHPFWISAVHGSPSQRSSEPGAVRSTHPKHHHQLTEGLRQWRNVEASANVNSCVIEPCSRPKLFKYLCTYASVRRYSTDLCSRALTDSTV